MRHLTEGIVSATEYEDAIVNKSLTNEDWQPAIQQAIDDSFLAGGGTVRLPKTEYSIYSTITVKPTVELVFDTGAVIKPKVDIDVIKINRNGKVRGGVVDVSDVSLFTKSCILLNGDEKYSTTHETFFEFMELRGNRSTISGNAIRYYASGNNHNISWVQASNITISYFDKGVFLECQNGGSGNQWVNGNFFNIVGLSACRFPIYLDGSMSLPNEVSGNTFENIQIQPSSLTEKLITIKGGSYNRLNGMFWDSHVMISNEKIELGAKSSFNVVDSNIPLNHERLIDDSGLGNQIISVKNTITKSVITPPSIPVGDSFNGDQDDFLAFADKRFSVQQVSGSPVKSGNLGNMFSIVGNSSVTWDSSLATPDNPVIVEVDFGGLSFSYMDNWGVLSAPWKEHPKNIKIEACTAGIWKTVVDTKGNDSRNFIVKKTMNNVSKLRYTFSESNQNTDNLIRINRLFVQSTGNEGHGHAWFPRNGGKIYGDIDMDGKYVKASGIVGLKPVPSSVSINNSFFVDNKDNILKFKDNNGAIRVVNLT